MTIDPRIDQKVLDLVDLYDETFPHSVDERRASDLQRLVESYSDHGFDYACGMIDGWNREEYYTV